MKEIILTRQSNEVLPMNDETYFIVFQKSCHKADKFCSGLINDVNERVGSTPVLSVSEAWVHLNSLSQSLIWHERSKDTNKVKFNLPF